MSEVKVVAEEKFGELLAAVRKAQTDVMLFLEEKEQAALNQVNGIKTHLEHRSIEMEKNKQELEKLASISNTVLFLEVRGWGSRGPSRCLACNTPVNGNTENWKAGGVRSCFVRKQPSRRDREDGSKWGRAWKVGQVLGAVCAR